MKRTAAELEALSGRKPQGPDIGEQLTKALGAVLEANGRDAAAALRAVAAAMAEARPQDIPAPVVHVAAPVTQKPRRWKFKLVRNHNGFVQEIIAEAEDFE